MSLDTPAFVHDFTPGTINYGRGCIGGLGETLSERGLERAIVVCGRNVGANERLIGPVEDGLGDRLAGVFDETTPAKSIETVFDGVTMIDEVDADVIVTVGGGSSLDIAAGMSVFANDGRTIEDLRTEFAETGTFELQAEEDDLLPRIVAPTTLPGADLSVAAGLILPMDDGRKEVIVAQDNLMPNALFYDPDLFDTTPKSVLAGSAINGFDKGVEAIYSRFANPVTDSTAVRGLKYLRASLPELLDSEDPTVMERAVLGTMLVQHGVSIPGAYKINIIHAFGHALRNQFNVQQGVAHGIILPHALRLIFEEGGGRPDVLAEALVTEADPGQVEEAVVWAATEVRDGLGLPSRLRDVDGTYEDGLEDAAELVYEDDFLYLGPPEFDPSLSRVVETLEAAW